MAIKYPTAESLMGMTHCPGCAETDPPTLDSGLTTCCAKPECEGVDLADAQGACCPAVEQRLEDEAAAGHPAGGPPARPAARVTRSKHTETAPEGEPEKLFEPVGDMRVAICVDDANLVSHPGGKGPQPAPTQEPEMTATLTLKYNSASVHIDGLDVRTEGSEFNYSQTTCGALTRGYRFCTAKGQHATATEALAAAKTLAASLNKKLCKNCLAAAEAAAEVEAAEVAAAEVAAAEAAEVEVAELAEAAPQGRRQALGAASVTGWELLYDKPNQGAEVGRRYEGTKAHYALICKAHGHVHPLARLTAERAIRATGGWCPSC